MNKENVKTGGMLLAYFARIGCFTFGGGWSILAQMDEEFIQRQKLITKEELLALTAMGRSLPGIMITNISMLFGYHVGGIWGGACAVLGITCPAVLILSVVACFYNVLKTNYWCHGALRGIRAAVVPIIGGAAYSLSRDALARKKGVAICGGAFLLSYFAGVSNVLLVVFGVLAALILWRIRR